MNLLVFTPAYPHEGNTIEGLFNEQHALALKAQGIDVTVVLCKPWLPDWMAGAMTRYRSLKGLSEKEDRNGIDILYARYIHIPQYLFPAATVKSCAQAVLRTLKRFGRSNFDLIQVHSVWPVGLAVKGISHILNIPFVVTLHIEDDPELYSTSSGKKLYERMVERASAIVAVGSPLEKFIQRIIPTLNPAKLRKIPNGMDMEVINKIITERPDHASDVVSIVSVCNLWRLKGIDLNIRALADIYQKGIRSWEYTVVGDGPERGRLERLAGELGIRQNVHFTGRLSHQDAIRKIWDSNIFCMPSRSEAFGIVYLEAMACGKPVIGCFETGAEDIIINEKNGLLVAREDVVALAAALEQLILHPSYTRALGEAGRQRAEEFTWQRSALLYMEVYKQCIGHAL